MSGQPAARQWDLTLAGPILQGSMTVLIGSAGGKACAVCPGGKTVGKPVNPALGAKVLLGQEDLDFALPGPLPLVWQRQYSSYVNQEHGASCGMLGFGWKQGVEVWIEQDETAQNAEPPSGQRSEQKPAQGKPGTRLFDAAGRCISFAALAPGQSTYSDSEDLWLMRGGAFAGLDTTGAQPVAQNEQLAWAQQIKWAHLPRAWRADAHCILAASGSDATVWVFRPSELPHDSRWRLQAVVDRFGRSQELRYAQQGEQTGLLVEIKDGIGRRYRLSHQRVRAAHPRQVMAGAILGADSGMRLTAVSLIHNPQHSSDGASGPWHTAPSENQPWELVRYGWDAGGNLTEVKDRSGQVSRRFEYDSAHRMVMHQERSGVTHRYTYEDTANAEALKAQGQVLRPGAKVVEQTNEAGALSYRFEYLQAKHAAGAGNAHSSGCRVTDSLGRVSLYHFEGSGGLKRLVGLTHPDGSQEQWGYDAAGRQTRHTDELGRETWWRYDGRGQVLGVQQPGGEHSSQSWGAPASEHDGLLLSSSDAAGRTSHYRYDRWGRLIEHQAGQGEDAQTTRWRYIEPGQQADALAWIEHPVEITDVQGGHKQQGYNGSGLLSRYTDCSGQTSSWRFDVWGGLIESQNALGHKELHWRDVQGRVVRSRTADGREHRFGYNAAGQIQSIEQSQDPALIDREGAGNGAISSTTTFEHNQHGQLLRREHGGLGIALSYDAAGRLKTLINENAAQTEFEYDSRDRLLQEVGFDGRIQRNRFDAAGQLLAQWDGMPGRSQAIASRYLYDQAGRLLLRLARKESSTKDQDPAPDEAIEALSFEHDKGQLRQASHWQIAPQVPPSLHQLVRQEDPPQQPEHRAPISDWFELSEAELSRLWQASQGQAWLKLCSTARLKRDSLGRLVAESQNLNAQEKDPQWEHQISHQLGALGNRHSSELQGLGEIRWQSYGSGHVHGLLLGRQQLIDFERDALHRETGRRLHPLDQGSTAPTVAHNRKLDPQGRLLSQQLKGPHLGSAAQISQAQQALIGAAQERQYRYDALGQLVAVRCPGQMQSYRYDSAQRLIAAAHSQIQPGQEQPSSQISTWRIDPAGNRLPGLEETDSASWNQPHNNADWGEQVKRQLHNKDFDLLERRPEGPGAGQRIDAWKDNRIALHAGVRYHYDAQGNRTQARHPDGTEEHYRYNALGQLIEHTRITAAGEAGLRSTRTSCTHYRYDPFGRRLSKSSEGKLTHFGWDGDRLVHVEDKEHIRHTVYEAGSFVPMLQLSRCKGARNLAELTLGGAALQSLAPVQRQQMQDALQKAFKQFDPNTASGLPASAQNAMNPGWGAPMNALVRQGFVSLRQAQAEEEAKYPIEVKHIVCDHLGTPIALVDATGPHQGQITWAARYGAWGDIQQEYNPHGIDQLIRFQGQQWDGETGLHYNRFRYYDPTIGQYITQDPIDLVGGINMSLYANANSITAVDPRGLDWFRSPNLPPDDWVVGREGSIIEPGGLVGEFIENHIPAGRTLGEIHDPFVEKWRDGKGYPDWLVNIPSMPGCYVAGVIKETGDSIEKTKTKLGQLLYDMETSILRSYKVMIPR